MYCHEVQSQFAAGCRFHIADCGSNVFHNSGTSCVARTSQGEGRGQRRSDRCWRDRSPVRSIDYAKRHGASGAHPIVPAKGAHVRTRTVATAVLFVLTAGMALAQAPDPNLARNLAAGCANCHGTNGVSKGGMPSLAGQAKSDLVRKMQDFKAGRIPATVMTQLAKGYTDEQIDLVAGWFTAQKP
jgi:sulfide dehydrogenase cytochrome subunit